MKVIASTFALCAAAAAFAAAPAFAQEIDTPSSVMEAGFDDILAPKVLTGPVGATLSSDAGGVVSTDGDSVGLVRTPGDDIEPSDD